MYNDDNYYPDNLEFPWKKSLLASALLMGTATIFFPVGALSVGLIGLSTMAASFIRNRFIRYSLASYANNDFDIDRKLKASDDEIKAMDSGIKAATSTWEYIKSYQPFSPAFIHWKAFSAGFGAITATNYYHNLAGRMVNQVDSKMKKIQKGAEDPAEVLNAIHSKILPVLKACADAFTEKVQHFPMRLLNRNVIGNYFNLQAFDSVINNGMLFEDNQEAYQQVCKDRIKDGNKYKVDPNDINEVMVAFQKFACEYFNSQGIALNPKETAKITLRL